MEAWNSNPRGLNNDSGTVLKRFDRRRFNILYKHPQNWLGVMT